jgi:transposase
MPERYGSYAIAWRRLKRWSEEGIWGKIMESLRDSAYKDDMFSMDIVFVIVLLSKQKKGRRFRIQRS